MRHYRAGAPLEAGKPLTMVSGKGPKSTLYPAEGSWPDADPDDKRAGKAYPKGQAQDLVATQDYREGERVPEEELVSPAEYERRQAMARHDLVRAFGRQPPRRDRQPAPPEEGGVR